MYVHRRVLSRPHTKEYQRPVYKRMREFLVELDFTEEKVFETADETEALLYEQKLISSVGFDNVVNTQSHAFTGRKLKPEVGRLISSRLKDYAQRCRAAYGKGAPPEVVAKRSVYGFAHLHTPETRQRVRQSWRANPANARQAKFQALRMVLMNTGKKQSAEHLAKLSALRKGRKHSESHIAKVVAARIAGNARAASFKSKFRGVTWFALKKAWQSRFCYNKKTRFLGQFKHEDDAARAYDTAFEAVFGRRPNGTSVNAVNTPGRFARKLET